MISNAKGHRDKDQDVSLRLNNQEVMRGLCRIWGEGRQWNREGVASWQEWEKSSCRQGTETRITRCLFPSLAAKVGREMGQDDPQGSSRAAGEGNTPDFSCRSSITWQLRVQGWTEAPPTSAARLYLMFNNLKKGELPWERDGGGKERRLGTGMLCSQTCPLSLYRFLFTRAGLTFSCGSPGPQCLPSAHICRCFELFMFSQNSCANP